MSSMVRFLESVAVARASLAVLTLFWRDSLPPSSKSKFKVEILQPDPSDLIGQLIETKLDY